MNIIPSAFLGADDDWWESFRRSAYPQMHPYLTQIGAYGVGAVGYDQYIGTLSEDEGVIESELVELGFERNPIACYKSLPDGRESEGSWVLRHDSAPEIVEWGMQLHLTLFVTDDGKDGREIYAHYEDDWRVSPLAHLRESNFDSPLGVELGRQVLNQSSFLVLEGLGNV